MRSLFVGLVLSSLLVVSCSVKTPVIAKAPLVVNPLGLFETQAQETWRFSKATFFLWKPGVTGADVATVSRLSTRIGQLDELGAEVQMRLQPVENMKTEKRSLRGEKKNLEKELADQKKSVSSLEELVAQSPLDESLRQKLETERLKLLSLEGSVPARLNEIRDRIAVIDELVSQAEPSLREEENAINLEGVERLQALKSLVDWYETQPSVLQVSFSEDGVQVTLEGWDPLDGGGARSFSSQNVSAGGSISDVLYEKSAGRLQFRVNGLDGHRFYFSLLRSHYGMTGRRLSGDFTQVQVEEANCGSALKPQPCWREKAPRRSGVVRLVDRKN